MGCTSHAPRRSDTAVCSGVGVAAAVGGEEESGREWGLQWKEGRGVRGVMEQSC